MKKQTGNVLVALILVVIVVLLAFWYFMKSGYTLPSQTAQNTVTTPVVQNKSDLDSASKQLDGTDLNQMDSGINQLGSDSASF